jgi:hypothetical protein
MLVVHLDDLAAGRQRSAACRDRGGGTAQGIGRPASCEASRLPMARIARPGSGRDCTTLQISSAGRRPSRGVDAFALVEFAELRPGTCRGRWSHSSRCAAPDAGAATAVHFLEAARDQVEIGRAAGRDQDSGVPNRPSSSASRTSAPACATNSSTARRSRRGPRTPAALVAFEAGQRRPGARSTARATVIASSSVRQPARLPTGPVRPAPAAAAPADGGDFLGQARHPGQRIGQHEAFEIRVVVQQLQHGAHVAARHQLVRQQHAAHAEAVRHLHLGGVRQRDAPGAVGQLGAEQLRAHGGLAVRRQRAPCSARKTRASSRGCGAGRGFQDRHREAGVAMQHVPALHADRALAQRRRDRQALHAGLQHLFFQAGQARPPWGNAFMVSSYLFNSSSRSMRSKPGVGITSARPACRTRRWHQPVLLSWGSNSSEQLVEPKAWGS